MNAYNIQSLFIFFGLISLLGGVAASFFFKQLDSSARYWTVAALLWGVTGIPTVFRESLAPLWSYSIPIGLNSASFVLMGMGLARFYDQGPQVRRLSVLAIATLAFIVLMEWCRVNAGPKVTLILSSLAFGLPSILSIVPARQVFVRTGNTFAWHMQWVLLGLGLLHFLRLQGVITHWGIQTFSRDSWTLGLWSMIFVFGLLRYFMYIAMRIQAQADHLRQTAIEKTRVQANMLMLEQLAQHERHRSVGFISGSIGHELNQPLAAIQGYAELAQHQAQSIGLTDRLMRQCVDKIIACTHRASQMVQNIRKYAPPVSLASQSISLRDMLEKVCALLESEARLKNVSINMPTAMAQGMVQADPLQLSLVIQNVMRNALKAMATSPVRALTLKLRLLDASWVLSLCDTGPGFPADAQKFIDMPFDTERSNDWGVGLSVARHILAQYGGQLNFHNLAEGGACVQISLPCAADTELPPRQMSW
ncbi:hypothetical protein B9Z51_07355 [Limnohabitans sp. T6-5]|uniref:sensor histidine kinase n=1 Tax=Limnohabitans sp. T6-5 TaxID=1100724 RepID=UPI000D380076|nr:HAMP domain-containing sensor histidine kinase [Limnohabitans sp. T6-5]PUE08755.1 hypothetical protein B9Z51_07355 [Limnohabitans sp. T6-5]